MATAFDPSAVIATRNMVLWWMTYDDTATLPLDTVDYGTDMSTLTPAWTAGGLTEGGLTFTITRTLQTIQMDQLLDPVLRPISARQVTFATKLGQDDPTLMVVAGGMGAVTTVAPGASTRGHDLYTIPSGTPADAFYGIMFEAEQQNGMAFRAMIVKGIPTGSPSGVFGDATKAASYAFEFTALPPASGATVTDIAYFSKILPPTS